MAMTISFVSLRKDHNDDIRRIPIASLRESYSDVSARQWQKWRNSCEIPKRARLISAFSAIRLWIIAGSKGSLKGNELREAMKAAIRSNPEKMANWIAQLEWAVGRVSGNSAIQSVINALNAVVPHLDVIHRQRLYDWFRKAGMKFSTRAVYSRAQILRVVAVAIRGIGLGRPRRQGGHFF
jgi:hypothetical protein